MDELNSVDKTVAIPVVIGIAAIGPCVLWTGGCAPNGYGKRKVGGRTISAHRQAWTEAYGDPGASHVCHRCDIRTCINVEHLFLGTHADNMADRGAKGRDAKGERNGNVKVTADEVREIRASTQPEAVIAHLFGVSTATVSRIRLRQSWAHVSDAEGRQSSLTGRKGERNGGAKLTTDQVCEIRASTGTAAAMARRLGVTPSTVSQIRLRRSWVHLP